MKFFDGPALLFTLGFLVVVPILAWVVLGVMARRHRRADGPPKF